MANKITPHADSHKSKQVCCVCRNRYAKGLLEVWASHNWHPICRACLDDIGLGVFGPLTEGRLRTPMTELQGQRSLFRV